MCAILVGLVAWAALALALLAADSAGACNAGALPRPRRPRSRSTSSSTPASSESAATFRCSMKKRDGCDADGKPPPWTTAEASRPDSIRCSSRFSPSRPSLNFFSSLALTRAGPAGSCFVRRASRLRVADSFQRAKRWPLQRALDLDRFRTPADPTNWFRASKITCSRFQQP